MPIPLVITPEKQSEIIANYRNKDRFGYTVADIARISSVPIYMVTKIVAQANLTRKLKWKIGWKKNFSGMTEIDKNKKLIAYHLQEIEKHKKQLEVLLYRVNIVRV